MLVGAGTTGAFGTAIQRQRGRFLRQESLFPQIVRNWTARGLCINANGVPFPGNAGGPRYVLAGRGAQSPYCPLDARTDRHRMRVISSEHSPPGFQKMPHLAARYLVTLFLPDCERPVCRSLMATRTRCGFWSGESDSRHIGPIHVISQRFPRNEIAPKTPDWRSVAACSWPAN
jgi:hypothetical protein